MVEKKSIPIIVIAGPTASGKTDIGVLICKEFNGEVVSADSMQIYKHLNIGTAKPNLEERQGIPHHLMDFLELGEKFSVADYVREAHRVIDEIRERGKLPVVVGGTGLYINSLIDNIDFSEVKSDPVFRQELEEFARQEGNISLWKRLESIDPEYAKTLHPNNQVRVIRALEVWKTTGFSMTEQQIKSRTNPSPYNACTIALGFRDRQTLYNRINQRVLTMMENGLLEEAKLLLEGGHIKTAKQAIGYKELAGYLAGEESLKTAVARIQQESRRYAKRQITWFSRDERYKWFYRDDFLTNDTPLKLDTQSIMNKVKNTIEKFQKNL